MDSLLALLVVGALAALSNWLQRRAHRQDQLEPPEHPEQPGRPLLRPTVPPRRPGPTGLPPVPRPPLETTLERELRRLLGEEPPPPASPPVKRKVPPEAPHREPVHVPLPAPKPPVILSPPRPVPEATRSRPLADLSQPTAAFDRAQHLHETIAERLKQVDAQTEKHGPKRPVSARPTVSAEHPFSIIDVRRRPEAARQAFIASLIFSAPKGLES